MIGKDYEYNAMANSERTLWWYRCLHALTLRQIREYSTSKDPIILDAGCGTGGLITYLKNNGFSTVEGFDFSPYAVEYTNKTYGLQTKVLSVLDANAKDAGYPLFDVIVSNDVLSLLQPGQDAGAIENLLAMLRPGGILIINLAALRIAYGMHDVALNVLKRYSKKEMQRVVGDKATIKKMLYWPFLLSPLIFSIRSLQRLRMRLNKNVRLVSDVKNQPAVLNYSFYWLTSLENRLLPSKPWGSSLLTVLQKP